MWVLILFLSVFTGVLMSDPRAANGCPAPVGPRAVWGVWAEPETVEIWLADSRGVRLLAEMPIEPALTTPSLAWEDALHLRYGTTSHGGNVTVAQAWRVDLCGTLEFIGRHETSP